MSFSLSEYIKIDVGWGIAPDPTGELTVLPRPLAGFKWAASRQERMKGRGGLGGGEEGKGGERANGEEREKGEVGGIVPRLLGDRRPWLLVILYQFRHLSSFTGFQFTNELIL